MKKRDLELDAGRAAGLLVLRHGAEAHAPAPANLTQFVPSRLRGKRVGIAVLSTYPEDPRPRRAAEAFSEEGMIVDYVCIADGRAAWREQVNGITVFRVPITHRRGGKVGYVWEYLGFIAAASAIFAARCCRRRYDLIYINNMPDVLVISALPPKLLGSKVILDLHDPMPELVETIFSASAGSKAVRLMKWLEKWSMARADRVLTPNAAFQRLFGSRSCPAEKIHVVMNSPDEQIFRFRPAQCAPATRDRNRPFIIMYHGSLVERNGVDVAVAALDRVLPRIPEAQLHIYGKPSPFLRAVLQSAESRGIQRKIFCLGDKCLEDIVRAICSSDVGVIPNQRSVFSQINMPTRIFEYLALGKPVIAPRTEGIRDYFGPESLLFFEAGNAQELAEQIEFVGNHPREAWQITQRGQQVYQAHLWSGERRTLLNVVSGLLDN
ncbi:MAG: glycosyltransferase family 4 protein [Acidobacteria bacterium]|nr:glycosyltransferase family 4 protein [Acidobacteriota bacterium]